MRGRGIATAHPRGDADAGRGSTAPRTPTCRSSADNDRGARRVPQVRLRDAYTYHYRGTPGRMPLTRRRNRGAGRRIGRGGSPRAARVRDRRPNRARAAWSPARSPRSPAVRAGSTAASSPIRTKRRWRCSACRRTRWRGTARCPRPRRGRWPRARCARSRADFAVAVTGVAGPGGGTAAKPVGMVCFAWAVRDGPTTAATQHFPGDRAGRAPGVGDRGITRTYRQNRPSAIGPRD